MPWFVLVNSNLLQVRATFTSSETSPNHSILSNNNIQSIHRTQQNQEQQPIITTKTSNSKMNGHSNNNSTPSTEGIANKLARPNIVALHPYRCARDDYDKGILLDANENAIGPTSVPTKSINTPNENHLLLERYPCPYQVPLKTLYANYRNGQVSPSLAGNTKLTSDHVFVGVGSDEAIDLLMRIFCTPGKDSILITPPTYGMYKVSANVNDVNIVSVPLTPDFDLRVPEMLEAATQNNVKLIFVCSPGNPTCKAIPLKDIQTLANDKSYKGLIIVDEAYVDFSSEPSAISLLTQNYPNVVVLQTLSKAFGLAGIRCGFAIGKEDVIQLMNNVKAPYNVNKLTSEVAVNAMKNIETLDKNIQTLLEQREIMRKALESLDFVVKIYPSDSNFLLVRVQQKALEIYKHMADSGVVVRYRGKELHCEECLRITIGTAEENVACLDMLKSTYAKLVGA